MIIFKENSMGFLGSVFKAISDSASSAMDDMTWSKANDYKNSPLIREIDRCSDSDADAERYFNNITERLCFFYGYALARGVSNPYRLARVFKMLFSNSEVSVLRRIKRYCTSSNSRLANLSVAILKALERERDSELSI